MQNLPQNASKDPSSNSKTETNSLGTPPSISLPKGGGAIRGMGEKFAANPVTGTGTMSVPIPTSPGRSGFGPQLSLSYDSGSGNGLFGFGWSLSLPSVTRKTDKGLPRYHDSSESDVYILSGAEDLVPELEFHGRNVDEVSAPGFIIHEYRPRIEGLFARIERWTEKATGGIHWRSISRENITSLYGRNKNSRISDPTDPDPENSTRIFTWLICASYDDKGNAIVYEYALEDEAGIDRTQANERNRARTAGRYLKRIKYGNRVSRLIQPDLAKASWLFEVVFDYEEGHYTELPPDANLLPAQQNQFVRAAIATNGQWAIRPDPFSTYRAGFEVRTYRRCRRVLMFHRFPELNETRLAELGDAPYLVRATEFGYQDLDYSQPVPIEDELAHQGSTRIASFIRTVIQSGFLRDDKQAIVERGGVKYIAYLRKSLPPLEFEYSKARIQDQVLELDSESVENLPIGVDGSVYQWVDLDGEGVSGMLSEQAGAYFYKPNLGQGRFGPSQVLRTQPSLFPISGGATQLLDLSGNGRLDVVSFAGPVSGFYERTPAADWESFQSFRNLPNLRWDDPNLRFVDLDGDGHADILITESDDLLWYPSCAEEGFGAAQRVRQTKDEERGPRLVLGDGMQSIYLADLSGDGLTDLVRIRNGEICYWPNLGYGRFGTKVTMDNAPRFDSPDQFDQRHIRLADIDGSGTTDILYLGRTGVRLYFNQGGNRWSEGRSLAGFPKLDDHASVMTADLLGNGTACLVWSSPLPASSRRPLRYIDLMGGQKPHLLIKSANHLGAETQIEYASSTRFYLEDKVAGKPWITRVPFPVHVVERVKTKDLISGNRFVTRYAYHHAYFDGVEREFRGFGMVEQWDTEEFTAFTDAAGLPIGTNIDAGSHVPPVHTKTWFHTGIYLGRDKVSDFFAGLLNNGAPGEYYREPDLGVAEAKERLLPDTVLPPGLSLEEEREACRALKGMMLRQEIYAQDKTDKAGTPYTVAEQNFTVERIQSLEGNRHAVFFTHPREALNYHYERDPSDPRVSHALTLETDSFGNVRKALAIAYGRRKDSLDPAFTDWDKSRQSEPLITYTESNFTENDIAGPFQANHHRTPLPAETRTYELTGFEPEKKALLVGIAARTARFSLEEWSRDNFSLLTGAAERAYETDADPTVPQKRLIEHMRYLYRKDDLTAFSPLGKIESLALAGGTYKLALTPGLLAKVFRRKRNAGPNEALLPNPAPMLQGREADQGGYMSWEGNWWIPSGKSFFDPGANIDNPALTAAFELSTARRHFFAPRCMVNAFGHRAVVEYDAVDLLLKRTIDALGNVMAAENDYRVLQPRMAVDPNQNRVSVAFDALGMAVATAVMGKEGENEGDLLEGFNADPTLADLQDLVADPQSQAVSLLGKATTRLVYDFDRYRRAGQPPFAATLARETHFEPLRDGQTRIQITFSYSDGFGREAQKKIQAEGGKAPKRKASVALPMGDIRPGGLVSNGQGGISEAKVARRWVGSGRTVFNNKGKPVRKYEPFFSATHLYESEREMADTGVSPVLFYDPVERVVATLHPNHTYEKVVFNAWGQSTYDVNDTVAAAGTETGDPRTDVDIKGYVKEYFQNQPADWKTWHTQRIGGGLGADEADAALKSAAHADTPTATYLDTLGRPFLTIANNKVVCPGHERDGNQEFIATRIDLDIEGNQREVRDGIEQAGDKRGRIVMRYAYDMLGNRIHQISMEAGARWMLNSADGKSIRSWDSRDHVFRTEYDPLRRPLRSFVIGDDLNRPKQELLTDRFVYGEQHPDGGPRNLRGKLYLHFDQAGMAATEAYDFKGNPLRALRRLTNRTQYRHAVDWLPVDADQAALPPDAMDLLDLGALEATLAPRLESDAYVSIVDYDALNRPVSQTTPHTPAMQPSIIRPGYNDANLLERLDANLRGEMAGNRPVWTKFVNNIDYDAKGQRKLIEYGSGAGPRSKGVTTEYEYDPLTFRLVSLVTRRDAATFANDCPKPPPADWPGCQVQNLDYTYDPAGNITRIRDDAQQSIYFNNQRVDPSANYTYDSIYRLIEATGREHLGQVGKAPVPHSFNDSPRVGIDQAPMNRNWSPNDGNAMGKYTERYLYDAAGNFLEMKHIGNIPGNPVWTRKYAYGETSLIEDGSIPGVPLKNGNRLRSTTTGNGNPITEIYTHDTHGNMTRMPHLGGAPDANMFWDFRDQLCSTDLGGGGKAYYVYDASGQRVRKVWEKKPNLVEERIYLGGFEIYRKRSGAERFERESLHIMDDKQRIALVEARTLDTAGTDLGPLQLIRYQFGNHLGSASLELDNRGRIISYEEYTPYGSTSYHGVRNRDEAPKRYRYTGKERDEESGLYYHGARYYAPWLGRWTSCDPEDDVVAAFSKSSKEYFISTSLYTYVCGRVIVANDPNGRAINLVAGAIGAGIGFVVGFGINAAIQLNSGKEFNWKSAVATGVGGAISGGIGGLTMGASLAIQAGVGGVGASVAGGAVTRELLGEKQTVEAAGIDALVGGVTFGLGKGIGQLLSKSSSAQMSLAIRELEKETVGVTSTVAATTSGSRTSVSTQTSKTAKETLEDLPFSPDELEAAVSKPGSSNIFLQEKSPGGPSNSPSGAPTAPMVDGALVGSSFNKNPNMMANTHNIQLKSTAKGGSGNVVTKYRVHTPDPNPKLSPNSNSASGNTLTIEQGGRRFLPDMTPGSSPAAGDWKLFSTMTEKEINDCHIPIHR